MSENRLKKFLNKQSVECTTTRKHAVPILFSDSKGNYLNKKEVSINHPLEDEVNWWCKSGMSSEKAVEWLESNI